MENLATCRRGHWVCTKRNTNVDKVPSLLFFFFFIVGDCFSVLFFFFSFHDLSHVLPTVRDLSKKDADWERTARWEFCGPVHDAPRAIATDDCVYSLQGSRELRVSLFFFFW